MKSKKQSRLRIKKRIRKKISGSDVMPRLAVYRSNKNIACQLVDDVAGVTLLSASSKELGGGKTVEIARKVGALLADKAKASNVDRVVFDRSGYIYHGKVKALAEGARGAGLQF